MEQNTHLCKDGTKLLCHSSYTSEAKADILFCHGFQEHSGRYSNEAIFFNESAYNFLSYDQRSHGESSGEYRSYIDDFGDYLDDFHEMLNYYNLGENRPFFLFAHSMGGLVIISYLLERTSDLQNLKGILLSSPLLMPSAEMAPILQKLSVFVSFIAPHLKTVKLKVEEISRDPEERKKYLSDPLNYTDGVYARSAYSLLKQMKKITPLFKAIKLPFIIQHGVEDKLAEFQGSQCLYDNSTSTDKTLIPLQGFKHEITRDIDHHIVLENFLNWMDDHL